MDGIRTDAVIAILCWIWKISIVSIVEQSVVKVHLSHIEMSLTDCMDHVEHIFINAIIAGKYLSTGLLAQVM